MNKEIKPMNFRIDDLKLNKVIITDVYYWKDLKEAVTTLEERIKNKNLSENTTRELLQMVYEVFGNKLSSLLGTMENNGK